MRKWIPGTLMLAAMLHGGAASASGLLADLGAPVYLEDFTGEISFPLTPEVDASGFGGMVVYREGDPLPLAPTLTGGEMLIAVTESVSSSEDRQTSGAALPVSFAAGDAIGVRARFDGFEVVSTGQFLAAGVTLSDTTIANGAAGYLLDFQDAPLRLAVSNLSVFFSGYDDVFLTEAADAAIRAGDPFEVELRFDQTARTAQAALTVGSEVFLTEATTSTTFDVMQVDQALVVNTVTNTGVEVATIASDVQDFAVLAPEPGAGAAALAAALALGAVQGFAARISRIFRRAEAALTWTARAGLHPASSESLPRGVLS